MRWLLVLLLLAIPTSSRAGAGPSRSTSAARADNQSLAAARDAVESIRYDDAQRLLVEALKQGGNGPEELVEIYRLSAITAAVLGSTDVAELYYRRMLALDPDATLPSDASPRIRDPFVAAQAYMAAQQRFDVRATRARQGIEVAITDPLHMVLAVATLEHGVVRRKQGLFEAHPGLAATAVAPLVIDDMGDQVVVLDEHGNFLRVIDMPARAVPEQPAPASHTPWFRRWYVYAAPAVAAGGVTAFLFVDAQRTRDRLDDIIAHDQAHYFEDAETERRRWRGHTIFAWVGVGVTLGFTTTAIVMARTAHPVRVTPSVGTDHASLSLEAKF